MEITEKCFRYLVGFIGVDEFEWEEDGIGVMATYKHTRELNELGLEGYELVSVVPVYKQNVVIGYHQYFKQEYTES